MKVNLSIAEALNAHANIRAYTKTNLILDDEKIEEINKLLDLLSPAKMSDLVKQQVVYAYDIFETFIDIELDDYDIECILYCLNCRLKDLGILPAFIIDLTKSTIKKLEEAKECDNQ